MLRFRRYRIFVALAAFAVFTLYQFVRIYDLKAPVSITGDGRKAEPITQPPAPDSPKKPQLAEENKPVDIQVPAAESSVQLQLPPSISSGDESPQHAPPATTLTPKTPTAESAPGEKVDGDRHPPSTATVDSAKLPYEQGEGRLEVTARPSTIPPIHWQPQTERFPIPSGSTIQLPEGTPKAIPRIQHEFGEESEQTKLDRKQKLAAIKEVFIYAWSGYKRNAWMQDEQSPVTGQFRNPFCGWAATLVDSLDTLWIMDLKEEFEVATKEVKNIDFTTTSRSDIPLFETTIRYLGGLLAAYDISGGKHSVLLEKAVELADVMMGAFDTPNRMPDMYYHWKPAFASQPHRSGTRVVLAELGSLSVEFTRLSQLTMEPRYYDAVARITDALEQWQDNTRLPGLWPLYVDASGCKRPDYVSPQFHDSQVPQKESMEDFLAIIEKIDGENSSSNQKGKVSSGDEKPIKMIPLAKPSPLIFKTGEPGGTMSKTGKDAVDQPDGLSNSEKSNSKPLSKRELSNTPPAPQETPIQTAAPVLPIPPSRYHADTVPTEKEEQCIPQGLASPSSRGRDTFTLGSMADSTYEYLPKEYILLGGLVEKYRSMYEHAADTAKDKLLFRPMTSTSHDILMSGSYSIPDKERANHDQRRPLKPEGSHLTCFVGGMFAMAAKIFEREGDLDIAAKLTEGCVWAYDSTQTGIMPEAFEVAPCESRDSCAWNETRWWDFLDPYAHSRQEVYDVKIGKAQAKAAAKSGDDAKAHETSHPSIDEATAKTTEKLRKREADSGIIELGTPVAGDPVSPNASMDEQTVYVVPPPPSHEEYVRARIEDERLPPGFTSIHDRRYILRPEAIESVFYMYRITGDQHWREVGWRMFAAVQAATHTTYGNSAIDDVTKKAPRPLDQMESFWLAETLKYFYLLFSEESLISLDDWVLNTEAHPFKRPK